MSDPRKMLALRERFGCVYECGCGTIHLAVGPVELKLNRGSLLETFEMLGEAVLHLEPLPASAEHSKHVAIDPTALHHN